MLVVDTHTLVNGMAFHHCNCWWQSCTSLNYTWLIVEMPYYHRDFQWWVAYVIKDEYIYIHTRSIPSGVGTEGNCSCGCWPHWCDWCFLLSQTSVHVFTGMLNPGLASVRLVQFFDFWTQKALNRLKFNANYVGVKTFASVAESLERSEGDSAPTKRWKTRFDAPWQTWRRAGMTRAC